MKQFIKGYIHRSLVGLIIDVFIIIIYIYIS